MTQIANGGRGLFQGLIGAFGFKRRTTFPSSPPHVATPEARNLFHATNTRVSARLENSPSRLLRVD
jgi:hypothetical protein